MTRDCFEKIKCPRAGEGGGKKAGFLFWDEHVESRKRCKSLV